jgi:L-2-hydroxyglutarate oxidase
MRQTDVVIIGGGIVGLATALALSEERPDCRVLVLEKESAVAQHQTGHNSGVLHSGIYYKPGSLKAQNCRAGKKQMEAFCLEENIPFDLCGKVIVAVEEKELPNLEEIYRRGQANGVQCTMISHEALKEIEPHVAGIKAVQVPEAGIVNYKQVCERLVHRITTVNTEVLTAHKVVGMTQEPNGVIVQTNQGDFHAQYVINCSGLYSDRITKMSGVPIGLQIIPFRGEYFELKPEAEYLCNGLVYPVPDPAFPFLGVHFTRMIQGGVECGPNAVFAFAREGYTLGTLKADELMETLKFPGFWRLCAKHWQYGAYEMWRSVSKKSFTKALQRLIPMVQETDLLTAGAGVRAQAVNKDGSMVDDFMIYNKERVINICNAPSPAATASLNIGRAVFGELKSIMT